MIVGLICLWIYAAVLVVIGIFLIIGGIVGLVSKELSGGELFGVLAIILGLLFVVAGGDAGWRKANTIIYTYQHEAVCTGRDCTDDIHKVERRGYSSERRAIYPIIIPMSQPRR